MREYLLRDEEQEIIIDEKFLLPEYQPTEIEHREKELKVIAQAAAPLIQRRTPENLFIYGPSGTGKTTCVREILSEVREQSSSVITVYSNCWENYTQLAVYNKMAEEMRLPLPRRGLAGDEIFDKILRYIKAENKKVLIVLDDIDGLRQQEVLHVIGKSNERGVIFGIIGISNNKNLLTKLDPRIRSMLRFVEFEFKEYDEDQLFSIINIRASRALKPGSYDERLLRKISRSVSEGSARLAIERLWRVAKKAEQNNQNKIRIQDFEDIVSDSTSFKISELNLSEEEQTIIEILKTDEMESAEIYDLFCEKKEVTKRQLRNYIEVLEKKGLVKSREGNSKGLIKPKIFRLKKK